MDLSPETNLVLIGMPGAGKSTIGVLLAKATARAFLDTDVHIQSREGRRLQEILDTEGRAAFCRIEERRILELHLTQHVIATGGSVVYSAAAMAHLKRNGLIVLLDLPFELLTRRLRDIAARGIVREPGQSLRALYEERQPLYREYADITVPCALLNHEQTVAAIVRSLPRPA